MPNDAKLGLIVGVGLVIGVAVVFFRKDLGPPEKPGEPSYVTPVSATRAAPANPRGTYRSVKAKAVTQEEERAVEEGTMATADEKNQLGYASTPKNGQDNGVRMTGPIDRPDRLP
jgi:hypothetical protein